MESQKLTIVEDIEELKELLVSTYGDLQVTLQSEGQTDKDTAITTAAAAFNLAIGTALQRINKIAQSPSLLTPRDEGIEALAKLTWQLLRISPFLGNPNQNILVAQCTGSAVERLDFDKRLRSKEHCGFLFQNVRNFLVFRTKSIEKGESVDQVNAILQAFCPPLMTYFAKDLSLLDELRKEEKEVMESLAPKRPGIAMIRRFLLQAVDEVFLLVWAEKEGDTNQSTITFAQRIRVTGLYMNRDLANWAVSEAAGLGPQFVKAGTHIEMVSWTSLFDSDQGMSTHSLNPHRVFQEGVPDDIPPFDGEKVVVFFKGSTERKIPGNIFPLIDLDISKEGLPLTKSDLQSLSSKIKSASFTEVESALRHQMGRGAPDEMYEEVILRLQMGSLQTDTPVEALN